MSTTDPSLTALLRDLISDLSELIREELRLAQAEAAEKVSRAQYAVIAIAAGLLSAFCALLILLQALVIGLAEIMPAWAASLCVGGVMAVAAVFLVRHGQSGLSPANLVPERTLDSIRRDKDLVMEKVQS
ncbi:MAG: hypothetical protein K0Q70_53 [Rhodospirillales bacterium]|jgi:hypothetical protein|nr:hypothetical protein [Rhodospirillales bacterium]